MTGTMTESYEVHRKAVAWQAVAQEIILTADHSCRKIPMLKTNCNYSLYLFHRKNKFRSICWKVLKSKQFEWGLLALIAFSTLILAVDTYYLNESSGTLVAVLNALNYFFIACFTIEAVLKIVAQGLLFESSTYFRELWNITDFIVLVFSFMDLFLDAANMKMFRVLRLLRVFRALRYLSGNNYIKVMFAALIKSFGALCNALVLIIVIFIMCSIVGVHFFAGRFQYCSINKYENSGEGMCVENGGEWLTYHENFDNVLNGLIYLFGMTNQEGWTTSVHQALDCTGVGTGPRKDAGWYYGFYYIVFIFLGPIFLMKIFVGIMFYNFKKAYKDELGNFKGIVLTQDRLDWIEMQKFILAAEPDHSLWGTNVKAKWRLAVRSVVTSFYFELFVTVVVVLNVIELALVYDKPFDENPTYLKVLNVIVLAIYTGELVLKLIGLGSYYWCEPWNLFEFLSLAFNYIDIALDLARQNSAGVLRSISQVMRILRILRIARVFKLLRNLRNLQTIIEIVQICLPSIINVFALTAFVFFIYAILGCYLFHDVPYGEGVNEVYNFQNFGKAIVLILKLSSGEDSNTIMYECARVTNDCVAGIGCGYWYSYIYFISFKIVINFVMLNLFVLVVLHFFDKHFISESHNVNEFKMNYDAFKDKWVRMRPRYWGNFVSTSKLLPFFRSLPPAFGFESEDINVLSKQITTLKVMQ